MYYYCIFLSGAHIGPEPTTDRFVAVMVCLDPLWKYYMAAELLDYINKFQNKFEPSKPSLSFAFCRMEPMREVYQGIRSLFKQTCRLMV